MKVTIAMDSLKGSLSSMEAGFAVKKGILKAHPTATVILKPLADGGEGTTEALIEGFHGEKVFVDVTGPLGNPVKAYYGYLPETDTVVLEMASAAGITLEKEQNPAKATTYGVGEMILDALKKGYQNFIIGIGGSATNDAGIGMLTALGFQFLDKNGNSVGEGAQALANITTICTKQVHPLIKECKFRIASDVTNPLCGPNGATYVYGPQKGVTEEQKPVFDAAMANFAEITKQNLGNDYRETKGAGAAGGLGFAFLSYLNATLEPGISLILDAISLESELKDSDIVVTGEGKLDFQTSMGKAPIGVAKLAKRYNAKVIAFAGAVTKEASACNEEGIDAFFPIVRGITTLEEAMDPETAKENLTATAEQVFRLLSPNINSKIL